MGSRQAERIHLFDRQIIVIMDRKYTLRPDKRPCGHESHGLFSRPELEARRAMSVADKSPFHNNRGQRAATGNA